MENSKKENENGNGIRQQTIKKKNTKMTPGLKKLVQQTIANVKKGKKELQKECDGYKTSTVKPVLERRQTFPCDASSQKFPPPLYRRSSESGTEGRKVIYMHPEPIPKPVLERPPRKSSFCLRKKQDNELGYQGRSRHRHSWQEDRQKKMKAFELGIPEECLYDSDD